MPKKILIVDDEPDILKALCFRLEKSGYEVLTAVKGDQALEIIERTLPDLVLLDLRLPGKDGFEVLAEVRSSPRTSEIPVVFLTASASAGISEQEKFAKADGVVLKPFDISEVMEKIESLTEKPGDAL